MFGVLQSHTQGAYFVSFLIRKIVTSDLFCTVNLVQVVFMLWISINGYVNVSSLTKKFVHKFCRWLKFSILMWHVPLQWRHNRRDSVSNFVRGIHRWPVNSAHKWPVTRKIFPFHGVITAIQIRMIIFIPCVIVFLQWMCLQDMNDIVTSEIRVTPQVS